MAELCQTLEQAAVETGSLGGQLYVSAIIVQRVLEQACKGKKLSGAC